MDPIQGAVAVAEDSGNPPYPQLTYLHPLNDPECWAREPAYSPPSDVDVKVCQKEIDSISGVTRENQPIYKLAWSGDRSFWHEVFMSWHADGKPDKHPVKRPRVRYKTIRDGCGKLIRDVFPPRWLILCRLEPEQYEEFYKDESWFFDPDRKVYKQIRPDEVPPVYWLWYATVARHGNYCCGIADKNKSICYGEYAPPRVIYEILGQQRRADAGQNIRNPFAKISQAAITRIENKHNNYKYEVARLKIESEIFIDNPMALIGPAAAMAAGITVKKAREIVKGFYDRKMEEVSGKQ